MNVIFLSIGGFKGIESHDQYPDLLREFRNNGYEVYIVCSNEKRTGLPTEIVEDHGAKILRVRIGNITQSNIVEKGIATVMVGQQYKRAINRFFPDVKFDLILYTTPPITIASVVEYLKTRDKAFAYLILKDIFPQNALDLGILRTDGWRGIIYKYFRSKEKKLYNNSDKIGTMSNANSQYLLKHNPEIGKDKIEICPNCIEPRPIIIDDVIKVQMREKYGIPRDKKIFVYGGNLGKPQDIPFLIQCIRECMYISKAFFWIIGNGTEFKLLEHFANEEKPTNFKLSSRLPKEDYDALIASCDVGLVVLNYNFTIPNFPSRILSYMQAGLPVLSCTDKSSDLGQTIVDGNFGWKCKSDNTKDFVELIDKIVQIDLKAYGEKAKEHLYDYSASKSFSIISASVKAAMNGDIK